jgi:hypothetical protein
VRFGSFCLRVLAFEPSPLVHAIIDSSEGRWPATITDAQCREHFGCGLAEMPREARRTVAVRAGGRGGKSSRLLAPKALHAAWTVPLPTLNHGEVASALIVAPDLKLARQTFSFCLGYVEQSPLLQRYLVKEPTKDTIDLARPDGKRVRVEILAATRGGRAVRARTLVFAGLDEACLFFDDKSGVVNDADIYRAVHQRVVPGGQTWIVSTPWLADTGILEGFISKDFGRHENTLCCIGGTRALNPNWDPDGTIERDLREQDPDAAVREIDGIPLAGGAGAFFEPTALIACVAADDELEQDGRAVAFGGDLGFVRDSSALVGATLSDPIDVVVLDEVRPEPGQPLKPSEVVARFGKTIRARGAWSFCADGHYRETAREHLEPAGVDFVDAPSGQQGKSEVYLHAKKLIHERRVRLPNNPRLLTQLRQVVSRPMPGGGVSISTPRRKAGQGGGGHGDLVSALVLALWQARDGVPPRPWLRDIIDPSIKPLPETDWLAVGP